MGSFQDSVITRRRAFIADEEKAARELQKALRQIQDEALSALDALKERFSSEGEFDQTPAAIRATRNKIEALQRTISSVTEGATETLIEAREESFKQAVRDVAYSLEKELGGTPFEITGRFEVVNKKAAEIALRSPVLGVKPEQAFSGVKGSIGEKYRRTFMNAVLNGEDTKTTAKRLKEIGGITERAATRIARTNLNAAMNDGLKETIEAHDDIFDGYTWNSTLDNRTSEICRKLDGKFFPLGTTPPGPPAHPNCRSTLVPHFKNSDVQKFLDNQDRRVRDPNTGKTKVIKGGITYKEWEKKQGKK